ncbi:MAG TPA: COX15/CtaA family protein [Gemmatimonadaceae bacterium]|nr:COX15/CtaA family protein [Gemmatimonadaceae bacterium]
MTLLRRLGLAALALAILHIILAPVVRITGSGMGCGPHWPTCHGYWFPPLDRMDLVIEVMHRYIAASLILSLLALLGVAIARRAAPRVGGSGGVLRGAALAVLLTVLVSVLGGITVKLHLPAVVTASHFVLAMLLVAALVITVQRAGGLGAADVRGGGVSRKTHRGVAAAAILALAAVAMGALTAKVPGAAAACQGFPLCSGTILPRFGAQHVQFTHRMIAFLLLFHLVGLVIAVARRGEHAVIIRTSRLALAAVGAQIVVAAGLVLMNLPQQLQWLHSAMATVVWLAVFTFYALARRGALGEPARVVPAAEAVLSRPDQALPAAEPARAQPHSMAVIVARGADL